MTPRPITAVVVLWVCIVAVGLVLMTRYDSARGATAAAPLHWPSETTLARAPLGVTVVMFVHPDCPCTRASRAELAEISRTAPPTAKFVITADVAEARRFGAQTSGDVVVYDMAGRLRFHGGITIARGHVGHNLGEVTVEKIVHGAIAADSETPVFGCALENS